MRIDKPKTDTIKKAIFVSVMSILAFPTAAYAMQPEEQSEVHVAVNGSDESGDGTQSSPYGTVAMAARKEPGSVIIVHGGEYGPIELGPDCSGSKNSPTVIRPEEGETVIVHAEDGIGISLFNVDNITIDGLETVVVHAEDGIGISLLNVDNITLDGLETDGGTHGIEYMSTNEAGDQPLENIMIRNCTVHGVRGVHGICVYACNDLAPVSQITIEGCEVFDCECGSSETMVLNGNIDGFLIAENTIHDSNNIGIDMIGFEGTAKHSEDDSTKNPYEVDQARNGICRDNVIYNISTDGNAAYYEDGEYDPSADGIYVDGGRDIEIYNNFIFNCDIGLEVATEHSPDDNELFRVSGIRVHDNVIADCNGWTGICFGGYDKDLGFTEECEFDHNTLVDNDCQIGVQRSRNNRIHSNLILGGETGVEFNDYCDEEDMINDIYGNAVADLADEESWSAEYGKVYSDRMETAEGFRSLIEDVGSRFVPGKNIMEIYERQRLAH